MEVKFWFLLVFFLFSRKLYNVDLTKFKEFKKVWQVAFLLFCVGVASIYDWKSKENNYQIKQKDDKRRTYIFYML